MFRIALTAIAAKLSNYFTTASGRRKEMPANSADAIVRFGEWKMFNIQVSDS